MKNKIIICIVSILVIGFGLYVFINYKMPEDKPLSLGTSLTRNRMGEINNFSNVNNYSYSTRLLKTKDRQLKEISYTFWDNIDLPKDMYPQGICFSDEYLFVTMYAIDDETMGTIMIFEKESGKHLLSLGMDTKSHLGGIAFDGNNLWICNSYNMSIERIPYELISNAIKCHENLYIDVRNLIEVYPVNIIPSCITYYDGRLWIATHSKVTDSQMMSYRYIEDEDHLEFDEIYHIPAKVQGIAFEEDGSVILSTSYGRKKSSYLKIYSSVDEMSENVDKYEISIEMPPCSEGIAIYGGKYYVLFESAGEKYLEGTDGKGKSVTPLDKILIIDPS